MQPKTYHLYVHTSKLDVNQLDGETAMARNIRVLHALGAPVPDGVTPLFVNADSGTLDIHNLVGDVVQRVVLLDGLRWKSLATTLKIDIMKVAHRMLAVTSCRAFNVVLPNGETDFALKPSW